MSTLKSRLRRTGEHLAVEHLEGRRLLTTTGEFTHLIDSTEIGLASLASGDVDGDGDLDILLADGVAGWKENLGDGTFAFRSNIGAEADLAEEVFPGDIDGDGDLDVVTLHRYVANVPGEDGWRTRVAWLENIDGKGGFSSGKLLASVDWYVNRVDFADIDNDRDADVLFGAAFGGRFHNPEWLENKNGTFVSAGHLGDRSVEFGYDFVDVDGDARIDLVLRDQELGPLVWYRSTPGGLQFEKEIPLEDSVWTLFDYDGDGDADLATSSVILMNDGQGEFGQEVAIGVYRPQSYEFLDVDVDGDFDLIYIGRFAHGSMAVESGVVWNHDGEWVFPDRLTADVAFSATYADFTGDGIIDLLYQSHNPEDGDTNLKLFDAFEHERSLTDYLLRYPQLTKARDMDGDGDFDLIVSSSGGGTRGHVNRLETAQLQWYENLGDLQFGPRQLVDQQQADIEFITPVSGDAEDIDGDGSVDLVTAYKSEVLIRFDYFKNQEVDLRIDAGRWLRDLRIVDVDRDGDLDVLALSIYENSVLVLFNDGSGRDFRVQNQSLDSMATCWGCRFLTDVDLDGDYDIVSGGRTEFDWFENVDGVFQAGKTIEGARREQFFTELADMDGDGDLDRIQLDPDPYRYGIGAVLVHETRLIGDVNDDGKFDSTDLTLAFAAGEYEDGIARNSTFVEGDWNGDGEFDTSDIVAAFQAGNFVG
ncbi:MAG: VCBS repeat-containing protein [Planctomycetales bacterium]|nr:VCBS repeat-containing protein [Planctomycetales bacterium]